MLVQNYIFLEKHAIISNVAYFFNIVQIQVLM